MKPRVYIETTIPSYLTARPSKNPVRAAEQQVTREWWEKRDAFELFVSELVREECQGGDPEAAMERIAAIVGIPVLEQDRSVNVLSKSLLEGIPLPVKATSDSVHIATAAVHGLEYMLTWNCAHIANDVLRSKIETICRAAGFKPPMIRTPTELNLKGEGDG